MFNIIIDNWHIWQSNGVQISNETAKKLYTAPDMDTAINFMYFEASPEQGRKLAKAWKEHNAKD